MIFSFLFWGLETLGSFSRIELEMVETGFCLLGHVVQKIETCHRALYTLESISHLGKISSIRSYIFCNYAYDQTCIFFDFVSLFPRLENAIMSSNTCMLRTRFDLKQFTLKYFFSNIPYGKEASCITVF